MAAGPLLSVFVDLNYPLVASRAFKDAGVETGFIQFNSCNPHLLATFWAPGKFDIGLRSRNRFGFAHVALLPGVDMGGPFSLSCNARLNSLAAH